MGCDVWTFAPEVGESVLRSIPFCLLDPLTVSLGGVIVGVGLGVAGAGSRRRRPSFFSPRDTTLWRRIRRLSLVFERSSGSLSTARETFLTVSGASAKVFP